MPVYDIDGIVTPVTEEISDVPELMKGIPVRAGVGIYMNAYSIGAFLVFALFVIVLASGLKKLFSQGRRTRS